MGGLNVFCQQYIGIIETKSIVNGIVKSYVFVLSKGWSCISSNNLYNNTIIKLTLYIFIISQCILDPSLGVVYVNTPGSVEVIYLAFS